MASLPIEVTLIGEDTTNPALPRQNVPGTLTVEHCNLTFHGNGFSYKIPLEQADSISQWDKVSTWGQEWRAGLTLFVGATIIIGTVGIGFIPWFWFFYWRYTATEVHIIVKAWDEKHGLSSITMFSLGRRRQYRTDAPEIIQQIWAIRGDCRRTEQKAGQVIYKER